MAALQRSGAVAALVAFALLPLLALATLALDGGAAVLQQGLVAGLAAALDAIGWVVVPQLLLATAVVALAIERVAAWLGAWCGRPTPGWLDPALESALLLGMLGTLSGMVSGFASLSPDEIEPAALLHGLGTALRSSVVGFVIVLLGVWVRSAGQPDEASEARS